MKMYLFAAAAAVLASPAIANHVPTSPNGIVLTNTEEMADGFETFGQCQSSFRDLRNDQRKSGMRGGEPYDSMDNGDYNKASKETTRCEEIDGRYYVVFNADGF